MSIQLRALLRNLAILLLLALPAALLLIAVVNQVTGVAGEFGLIPWLANGLLLWLVYAPSVAVGGVLHYVGVALLARRMPRERLRLLAVLTTPIIPATTIAFGQDPIVLWWYLTSVLLLLALYSWLLRVPTRESGVHSNSDRPKELLRE